MASGVTWDRSHKKWKARIFHGGKSSYLGRFVCRDTAEQKYLEAKFRVMSVEASKEDAR